MTRRLSCPEVRMTLARPRAVAGDVELASPATHPA
jgi:hypothetical protein